MDIPPSYTVTPEISDFISKIEANRTFINSKDIFPLVKQKIERVSILKSALYSAKIEGNEIEEQNFDILPRTLKKLEIQNIQKCLAYIEKTVTSKSKIETDHFLKLHEISMGSIIATSGKFRNENWAVFNSAGIAVYLAPPPSEITDLVRKLVNYINRADNENPVIKALISHLILEKIHPFEDGNGRIGRLLIYAVLKAKGCDFGVPVVLEEEINKQRDAYYYHLDSGLKETEGYLSFMLEIFLNQTEAIKNQLEYLPSQNEAVLELTPRQEAIYNIIEDHKLVSLDFIQRRFLVVPARTLRYDLKKLQDKRLIVKTSSTRGALYRVL